MINDNEQTNNIKFYVTDYVLEILFNFLKKDYVLNDNGNKINNLERLKIEIADRTENTNSKNTVNTKHPSSYFDKINEKINNIENVIKKNDFTQLNSSEKRILAEFLYQLEDLAEDIAIMPELSSKPKKEFNTTDVINQLHVIKTLALPIFENCTFHYDKNDSEKVVNINLVQDFNFLQKQTSCYKFYNFYPFNDKQLFKDQQDALNAHYTIMAKNYFSYLKDMVDKNENKLFVCQKPGVKSFANNEQEDNKNIRNIFHQEFAKLDNKYKERILFCISGAAMVDDNQKNDIYIGYSYDLKIDDLKRRFPKNQFLQNNDLKDSDICFVNGTARDPWAKIGDEGRETANNGQYSGGTTDAKFVRSSNEVEILYGVKITTGQQKDGSEMQHLTAKTAEIFINKTENIIKQETENYYQQFIDNMLKESTKNDNIVSENEEIILQKGNEQEFRNYIRQNYQHKSAYFIYNEMERKNNALVNYGNNNINNLNSLNNIIKNIHGKKCSWCCGDY